MGTAVQTLGQGICAVKQGDDWDVKPIGADEDKPEVPVVKKPTLMSMVYYLRNKTLDLSRYTLNAPVNGPALMKIFKDMLASGVTHDQIFTMIDLFAEDIKQIPLNDQDVPWKAFAARRGQLYKRVKDSAPTTNIEELTFDPRLEKYLKD